MAIAEDDIKAIKALVTRQFGSLCRQSEISGDWDAFAADFFPGASLYPAVRPAKAQTAQSLIERMQRLADTTLQSFEEVPLGIEVRVFGNVAVAIAGCEMIENDSTTNRGVEMMLLIKSDGKWLIASQAWEVATQDQPLPDDLGRRSD